MNNLRGAVLLGALFFCMFTASATPCPTRLTASTLTVEPEQPLVGQKIIASIDGRIADSFIVCWDANTMENTTKLPVSDATKTQIEIVVPGDPKQAVLTGVHVLSVVVGDVIYNAKIGNPPKLDSVTSIALGPGNDTFLVALNGEGFDAVNERFNTIQMNDLPLNVSWMPSNWNPSNCPPRTVCGYVVSNGRIIELAGIDPIEERSARFKVWIDSSPSEERTDTGATTRYWLAIIASAAATLAILGIVIVLVMKYLHPTVIEGDSYVFRALFLDKETNSYSLSKFQFYLWTIVAVFGYVYLAIAKNWFQQFFLLPPVPAGLPGIVAIAAGTAIGAQVVTNINGPKGAGQLKPSLADFVTSGDTVAAERVQFFVWTIVGALGFLMVVLRLDPRVLKELPDVPSSILTISGLSAFGYLGGKLARDPGPVIVEAMVGTGPDPDVAPPTTGASAAPASTSNSQTDASISAARAQLATAKQRLQPIAPSGPIQAVVAAANKSCDSASAAIAAAVSGGDPATVLTQVQKACGDADTAARETASAVTSMGDDAAKADTDNAATAASAAQQAAAAAQAVIAALQSSLNNQATGTTAAGSVTNFGRIELRGRMLSRDANFGVSVGAEAAENELDISFDDLQPSPNDDRRLKKPRVVERDSDSTDPNIAKRLLLVINLSDALRPVFVPGSTNTITVINPDSQKAVFKFAVPESQKAV